MKKISALLTLIWMIVTQPIWANKLISLYVNKQKTSFSINLPANPTTGYQWSVLNFDHQLLTLTEAHYQRPPAGLIGAGGQMQYLFTHKAAAVYPETTVISFQYARAWDKNSATQQKVKIYFVDQKSATKKS